MYVVMRNGVSNVARLIASALFVLLLPNAMALAQNPICATGFICQGSGCPSVNPNDQLSFPGLNTNDTIDFALERIDGTTGECQLPLTTQGGIAGVFTPTASPTFMTGDSTTVTFTAGANGTAIIKVGPPTRGAGTCPSGNITTWFTYTATSAACGPQTGTIVVEKEAVDGDGTTQFNFTGGLGAFTLTPPVSGVVSQTFTNVTPGTFAITEAAVAGWNTTLSCSDPTNNSTPSTSTATSTASINVAAGETVTCRFVNTRQKGTIVVEKEAIDGDGTTQFNFTGGLGAFSLTPPADGVVSQTFNNLTPGTFTLTETAVAGWNTTLSCTDPTQNSTPSTSAATNTASINVGPGETVTCRFVNARGKGTIVVEKEAVGGDGTTQFNFTGGLGAFSLTPPANGVVSQTFNNLTPGTFALTETAVAGWNTTLSCTDPTQNSTPSTTTATNAAFIDIGAGETVTCRYVNTRSTGSLTIVKNSLGGDGTFNFTGSGAAGFTRTVSTVSGTGTATSVSIVTGSVTVTEAAVSGFDLTAASCDGGSPSVDLAGRSVTLQIGADADIICTFTNTRRGTISIRKNAIGDDGTFSFQSSNPALPGFSLTTSSGTAVTVASNLPAGTYAVTEIVTDGWKLDAIACTGGTVASNVSTRTAIITLGAGDNAECTFTNTEVKKRTRTIIRNFMARRGDLLTSETGRPRLVERKANGSGGPSGGSGGPMMLGGSGDDEQGRFSFATSLSRIQAAAANAAKQKASKLGAMSDLESSHGGNTAPRPGFDVWIEGKYAYYDYKIDGHKSSGSFGLFRIGADYLLRPWLLVGALAQFDKTGETSSSLGYRIDGKGWMAGPYAEFQLTENLILDMKGLWGRSTNEISPFLTYEDTFETTRWLVSARLTGTWTNGPWHFSPRAEIVGYQDRQHAYVDTNGILIEEQTLTLGRVIAGPEVSYRYQTSSGGLVEPRVALKGLWTFTQNEQNVGSASISYVPVDTFRARLEAGIKFQSVAGTRVEISGSYEGLGESDLTATTGKMHFTLPLQ